VSQSPHRGIVLSDWMKSAALSHAPLDCLNPLIEESSFRTNITMLDILDYTQCLNPLIEESSFRTRALPARMPKPRAVSIPSSRNRPFGLIAVCITCGAHVSIPSSRNRPFGPARRWSSTTRFSLNPLIEESSFRTKSPAT